MNNPNPPNEYVYYKDVGIENYQYGYYQKMKKAKIFIPLGNEVVVTEVLISLETGAIKLKLAFMGVMGLQEIIWLGEDLNRNKLLGLTKYGVQVDTSSAGVLFKTIFNSLQKAPVHYYHEGIGWYNFNGKKIFRAYKAIGENSTYRDDGFDIKPKGSYKNWLNMVKSKILGRVELEVALSIGFSAVVFGYLKDLIQGESLFVNYVGSSTSGKTTAALTSLSVAGNPNFSVNSLAMTWQATKNFMCRQLTDNFGLPALFDEVSMVGKKDLTDFLYTSTLGIEKGRLNKELSKANSGSWATTILSTGEVSLLSYANKNNGIRVRLIEFDNVNWCGDAKTAEDIRAVIKDNYGHAASRLAKKLLETDDEENKALWNKCVNEVEKRITQNNFSYRISKKYALIYITSLFVYELLDIELDTDGILDFICENDKISQESNGLNMGMKAYKTIMEQFEKDNLTYSGCSWGKILPPNNRRRNPALNQSNTLLILKGEFEKIMTKSGFQAPNQIIKQWKEDKILCCESDREISRRKFGETSAETYELRLEGYSDESDS